MNTFAAGYWLIFVMIGPPRSYPIATVLEARDLEHCQELAQQGIRDHAMTKPYCVPKESYEGER